jgi:hypothetical protein
MDESVKILPRRRFLIGIVLLLAILLIANAVMIWWTDLQLSGRIAAIRAAGDPASLAELAPPKIPEEQNAASQILQLRPLLDAFSKDHARFFETPLGKAYGNRAAGEPPTADQISEIRRILSKYPEIEQGLARAAACPHYASRLDFSNDTNQFISAALSQTQDMRSIWRFLDWQIMVQLAEGHLDQAVEQGLTLWRLVRFYEEEPTLMAHLVSLAGHGMTMRVLHDVFSAGPVSAELRTTLDKELTAVDSLTSLRRALVTERAFSISSFESLVAKVSPGPAMIAGILGWPMRRMEIGVLDYYAETISLIDRPWHEAHERVDSVRGAQRKETGFGVMADLLASSVAAAYLASCRDLAMLRCLRVYNALTGFEQEHGRNAAGLEDLSLPAAATIDPFSGEPLKLRRTPQGWAVYSVGENGIDDGGDTEDQKDVGLVHAH